MRSPEHSGSTKSNPTAWRGMNRPGRNRLFEVERLQEGTGTTREKERPSPRGEAPLEGEVPPGRTGHGTRDHRDATKEIGLETGEGPANPQATKPRD